MTTENNDFWGSLKHFTRDENWGNPDRMDPSFVRLLDGFRNAIGFPFVLSTPAFATRGHLTHSFHYLGKAADGRFVHPEDQTPLPLKDHILIALRAPFGGVGIYTWSQNGPFVHFDNREMTTDRKIWVCEKEGVYQNLSIDFLKKYL